MFISEDPKAIRRSEQATSYLRAISRKLLRSHELGRKLLKHHGIAGFSIVSKISTNLAGTWQTGDQVGHHEKFENYGRERQEQLLNLITWCPFHAPQTKHHYASPSGFWLQVCFSKSSCAIRLKASAATVLSRSGVVIPHVQVEQHQPLKSSPSTLMRRLFMYIYLLPELWAYSTTDGAQRCGRELVRLISHEFRGEPSIEGPSPRSWPRGQVPSCPDSNLGSPIARDMQMFNTSREELHWYLSALASIPRCRRRRAG